MQTAIGVFPWSGDAAGIWGVPGGGGKGPSSPCLHWNLSSRGWENARGTGREPELPRAEPQLLAGFWAPQAPPEAQGEELGPPHWLGLEET